jgi:cellulose synthase/poly-beta-1,6-N-acetylglucosamine synthase-like glycosyltransferase
MTPAIPSLQPLVTGGSAAVPTVVVIIPFYNGADFIERSVKSVFEQSVPANE